LDPAAVFDAYWRDVAVDIFLLFRNVLGCVSATFRLQALYQKEAVPASGSLTAYMFLPQQSIFVAFRFFFLYAEGNTEKV